MTDDTFNVIVASKEDFEGLEGYKNLTQKQKDFMWIYAKKKMSDMLMESFWYSAEYCIERASEEDEDEDDEE